MSDFTTALLKLPDDAFFELVRNYLGQIKTPFNKHDLIGRLESLLKREETQTQIYKLLDREDKQLLSAIWLLDEPRVEEIFDFFSGRRSYLDLHHHLLNLEDRLLVYRYEHSLRLNPLLLPMLEERALSASFLFQSRRANDEEVPAPAAWLNDSLIASFLSFCIDESELLRADGRLRKRTLNRIRSILPDLAAPSARGSEYAEPRAAEFYKALIALALVEVGEGPRYPARKWNEFSEEQPDFRCALIAAGWAEQAERTPESTSEAGHEHPEPILQQARLRAEAILAVWHALPPETAVTRESAERLLASVLGGQAGGSVELTRQGMELFGILWATSDGYLLPAPVPVPVASPKPVVVQPNLSATLPQEVPARDAFFLARISQLTKHDIYPHFELTRDRLALTLREGVEMQSVVDRLQEMSLNTIPQNVIMTLRSWGSEYESMRLYRGVVLTIEPSRRFLVDQPAVAALVRKELGPGVYLVPESNVAALQSALADSGVELLPELEPAEDDHSTRSIGPAPSINRSRLSSLTALLSAQRHSGDEADGGDPAFLRELQSALSEKRLPSEQKQELSARIDRKLILSADQIQSGQLKAEKSEARGIDYGGKVRVIEQAIRSGSSFLELVERSEDGSPIKRLVEPLELQKENDELYLVGFELPERDTIRVRVRKLGLVRRIRGGLVRRRL